MNWKVFPGACAAPYWTTCVRIINTTGHPAEISIVFGPYKVDKIAIQPGEIATQSDQPGIQKDVHVDPDHSVADRS